MLCWGVHWSEWFKTCRLAPRVVLHALHPCCNTFQLKPDTSAHPHAGRVCWNVHPHQGTNVRAVGSQLSQSWAPLPFLPASSAASPHSKRPRQKIFLSDSSVDKCHSGDGINISPYFRAAQACRWIWWFWVSPHPDRFLSLNPPLPSGCVPLHGCHRAPQSPSP